jgi:hypothetical protein
MAYIYIKGLNEPLDIRRNIASEIQDQWLDLLSKKKTNDNAFKVQMGNTERSYLYSQIKSIQLENINKHIETEQDKEEKEYQKHWEWLRQQTPEIKYKHDLSRIKLIFKILGFNHTDPKNADKYKAFYLDSLNYLREYPNRTKVGDIFWNYFQNAKDKIEIKGNFYHQKIFKILTERVNEGDIIQAYQYEKS